MKMQETTKSLRIYFFVVGALNLLYLVQTFNIDGDIITKIFGLITVVFTLLFVYFAIRLKKLLFESTKLIINFIITAMIFSIFSQIYNMITSGFSTLFFIFIFIDIAINFYLISNVKRLAKQGQNTKQ
ncbi:MAG: hypothetical protein HQ539_03295 [Parcubacteria group bacterium]|nr:hypothetical protein [Parcubacteria group bacterium]